LKASHQDSGSPIGEMPSAGLWRRFMGAVYESVILVGVVIFFAYGYSALGQYRAEAGPARWVFQGFLFLDYLCRFLLRWLHPYLQLCLDYPVCLDYLKLNF
jgi:hypothetical protein